MPIPINANMPPSEVGSLVAEQFTQGSAYVHLTGVPFVALEKGEQEAYIRSVSSAIGQLTLSDSRPDSDVWRLDRTTSPSTSRIPYHTDNPFYEEPERIVGFWNVKSSAEGGENVLLPVDDVLDWVSLAPDAAELLEEIKASAITFANGDSSAVSPIIDAQGRARFDRRYVDSEHTALSSRVTRLLEEEIKAGQVIKLSEGDVLFFDNRKMLHSRQPYTDLGRISFRVRIKELGSANQE